MLRQAAEWQSIRVLTPMDEQAKGDTGLSELVMLLRFHGLPVDAEQLRHRFGTDAAIGIAAMLRCAKEFGLKARAVTTHWARLSRISLPAIGENREGGFFLLAKVAEDRVLIHDPNNDQPAVMGRAEFEAAWSGRLVLFTRRVGLSDLTRRFDIGWFLQAMHKYRRLLGGRLGGSPFLPVV